MEKNQPNTGLRYDPETKRHYRLIAGPDGRGIRNYEDPAQPAPNVDAPRTFSRTNPLALPQNPGAIQTYPAASSPQQSGNLPGTRRAPGPGSGSGPGAGSVGSGGGPGPQQPYGTNNIPTQNSRGVPGRGHSASVLPALGHLSVSDTRPNDIHQDFRTSPPTATPYEGSQPMSQAPQARHQVVAGESHLAQYPYLQQGQYTAGAETNVQMSGGYRQQTYRPGTQRQGTIAGATQSYATSYGNAYSGAYDERRPLPSQQPSYTAQHMEGTPTNVNQYTIPQGYYMASNTTWNQDSRLPHPAGTPRPNMMPPTNSFGPTSATYLAPGGTVEKRPSQGPPLQGQYRNDVSNVDEETIEDNISDSLLRGTPGTFDHLDPSFRVVNDHWAFFIVGRVFKVLTWEPQGQGNTSGQASGGGSVHKYGEKAFAKIYRYVVVRPRPKQGYSMCLRIATHGARGTAGNKMIMQNEHSIIYTGDTAPEKLPEEKKLNKPPIRVIPIDASQNLSPLSRIHYAKPYPVEHNVKVCEVGMIAERDRKKIVGYYRIESGYDTERESQPQRRQRRDSEAYSSPEGQKESRKQPERDSRRRR